MAVADKPSKAVAVVIGLIASEWVLFLTMLLLWGYSHFQGTGHMPGVAHLLTLLCAGAVMLTALINLIVLLFLPRNSAGAALRAVCFVLLLFPPILTYVTYFARGMRL